MSETPEAQSVTSSTEVSIRRAPRFTTFLILGGAVGAVVTLVLTMSRPADPNVGYASLFGYFLLFGVPAGILLGALVFLVLDVVSKRRARSVTAEVTTVEQAVEGELLED
jgi:hypothetical protein